MWTVPLGTSIILLVPWAKLKAVQTGPLINSNEWKLSTAVLETRDQILQVRCQFFLCNGRK